MFQFLDCYAVYSCSIHICSNLLLVPISFADPHDHGDLFFSVQLGGRSCHRPTKLHPAVLETGRAYATSSILGANARCRAMLLALREAIGDYIPPGDGDLHQA